MASPARALPFVPAAQTLRFMWLTSSGKPCPGPGGGCAARNEVEDTLDGWTSRGLPRTGWSYCRSRCHCLLVPMLPFGLDIVDDLDDGDGFDLTDVPLPSRLPGQPFADVAVGYDPEEFIAELESLPAVGLMREALDGIIEGYRSGTLPFEAAKAEADRVLGHVPRGPAEVGG